MMMGEESEVNLVMLIGEESEVLCFWLSREQADIHAVPLLNVVV